ncbi:hypothetical protein [Streptomyces cellostaticus]|uniref:hypothetical protein n=1 Tax=Streptomyces cellostaticus TaxID=67285 RepID=UPI0020272250|nr:hypothetical protein [Streptomyces cellostaticus]
MSGPSTCFHNECTHYAERLSGAGVDTELLGVESAYHGFGTGPQAPVNKDFVQAQLAPVAARLSLPAPTLSPENS